MAQAAVAGESGHQNSSHARKQIMQASGYSHLKGALGYPGMNWAVLVRVPIEEAAIEASAISGISFCLLSSAWPWSFLWELSWGEPWLVA